MGEGSENHVSRTRLYVRMVVSFSQGRTAGRLTAGWNLASHAGAFDAVALSSFCCRGCSERGGDP